MIRKARSDDEEAIWPLARALATSSTPTQGGFHRAFHAILQDRRSAVLVAADDDRILGYVHVLSHPAFHADGNIAWIEELFVDEEHRGTGIGRALMRAAERWARAEVQASYMALATRRAAAFYQAIGYTESASYFRRSLRS